MEAIESRLAKTIFAVEATYCEMHFLWSEHAYDSNSKKFSPRQWEQVNPGHLVQVGELDARPICLSLNWVKIDRQLVLFWECTSQVSDILQIEKWISEHFSGKWNGNRDATTNAMNFQHCLDAIDELNNPKLKWRMNDAIAR